MKTLSRIAAAGALAVALAACGEKSKPDGFLPNIPDAAAITLDTSAAAPAAAGVVAMADPAPVTTAGDDLALVHRKAEAMNAAIRNVFAHVEALTATDGRVLAGDVKEWGPADRCVEPGGTGGCANPDNVANLLLRARRYSERVGDFVVLARPAGSTSAADFKPVLAGYLIRGAAERRGAGRIWVNHPNLALAAPGFTGTGYLAAGFAAGPVAKTVAYRMLQFSRNPALHDPITAAFRGWKNGAGWVRARVAGLDPKLYPSAAAPGTGTELGLWRAVWAPAVGGRAFTVIADGDVPSGKYFLARACYPAGETLPSYKEWFECDKVKTTLAGVLPYPPARCVEDQGGQGTFDPISTTTASSWSQTACAWQTLAPGTPEPDELRPPSLGPVDADDDRDEDGDHTGLMPEPCPSTARSDSPDPRPPMMGGMQ